MKTKILLLLWCVLTCSVVHSQEWEQLKPKIVASLSRIESYPAAVAKGWINSSDNESERLSVYFEFVGDRMWREDNAIQFADEKNKQRIQTVYEAMGTSALRTTHAFDGKKYWQFSPYNLVLTVKSVRRMPQIFQRCCFLPVHWLHMGSDDGQRFINLVNHKKQEPKVESLGNGKWKLSQTNLGADAPNPALVGIRNRFIIVDEKSNFLVTEYYGEGRQGRLEGKIEWAEQDGFWYAKHGIHLHTGRIYDEWHIDEISFDPKRCRTRVDTLESTVPFATKIVQRDDKDDEISTTFKGGADGESEHKLREFASLKRLRELGKEK
jgi:hypothetical protein